MRVFLGFGQPAREQQARGPSLNIGRRAAPSSPAFSSSSVEAISVSLFRDLRGSLARNTIDRLLSSASTAGRSAVHALATPPPTTYRGSFKALIRFPRAMPRAVPAVAKISAATG